MPTDIKQVAVIGSGVMASQIVAHMANAGISVLWCDTAPKDVAGKNTLERLQQNDISAFMHPRNAERVTVCNINDDINILKNADWIVDAATENLQIKSGLYKKIDLIRKSGSMISSSTSAIPLSQLTEGQSEAFVRDFMITQFFAPVRHARLVELVAGPKTRPDAVDIVRDFCDRKLGKTVIQCNDTTGFVANRLGMFGLQSAVNAAMDLGLTVEETDEICGRLMGAPDTGVFALMDGIGIDLLSRIGQSLVSTLPPNDPYTVAYREPPLFRKMMAEGSTGREGKGGFYRFTDTDKGKVKESINLYTGDYAPASGAKNPTVATGGKSLKELCETQNKYGQFAWRVVSETLSYAFNLIPSTVPDITAIDEGMKKGFNWNLGPFELIDKVGAGWMMERLLKDNKPVPELLRQASDTSFYRTEGGKLQYLAIDGSYRNVKRAPGVLALADIKRANKPVLVNPSAAVWDIGDGVLCLEFTSKANAIDSDILAMLDKVREVIGDGRGALKGLVIYNEGDYFSVGANLNVFMNHIKAGKFADIEIFIRQGQAAYHALRAAKFPSVAAIIGMALGGGCEIALHGSTVQAHAEASLGLVCPKVGVIPGWGGCTQMLGRAFEAQKRFGGAKPAVNQAFETISSAQVSKSAAQARDMQFLRPADAITMNKDRLLFDAKQKVLELSKDYHPPEPWQFSLPGASGRSALDLVIEAAKQAGQASPHDVTVWKALAMVLCGGEGVPNGPITELQLMELECREFMRLIRTPETAARIEHMLKTGKPLRN
jgi:3-hydroxyacyl-CoA dehydrogenase